MPHDLHLEDVEALADKIRRGEAISPEETRAIFERADAAGLLYYRMLSMVRERRSLSELPATLKQIITTKAWQSWRWVGSTFGQNSLGAYLTSGPPHGVGIQLDTVEKLIADDPDALALYRDEMVGQPGAHVPPNNNVIRRNKARQGNSRAYALDRLKRERPDLFERVKAKELSANAAAKKAGWRKPPSPLKQLRKAWKAASPDERAEFLAEISAEMPESPERDALP